jgi:multiple sugar transport system ATP-binding protein
MPSDGGVAVELTDVSKTYPNGFPALRSVTLRVEPGEWLVLVGPSGCGKTTTLRIIAGLEEPSSGSILLDRGSVNRVPPWRRKLALLFQRPALVPTHLVRQNLAFGLPPSDESAVQAIAEMLDLVGELDRFPHQLSGGQQQRVALGRALARRVHLYMLDEPLGHLDVPLRDQLRRSLKEWHQRRPATVISVTHDPREAWALGDRVAVMRGGQVVQVGTPNEVYRKPKSGFVAGFFAPGPLNFFPVQLRKDGNSLQWNAGDWPLPIPYHGEALDVKEAVLGVRAEDVHVSEAGGLTMQVTLVEPTPQGDWITGAMRGRRLTGWANHKVSVGQEVGIMIDWTKAYVFDCVTDATLHAPLG